jgi:hypothetical protein
MSNNRDSTNLKLDSGRLGGQPLIGLLQVDLEAGCNLF